LTVDGNNETVVFPAGAYTADDVVTKINSYFSGYEVAVKVKHTTSWGIGLFSPSAGLDSSIEIGNFVTPQGTPLEDILGFPSSSTVYGNDAQVWFSPDTTNDTLAIAVDNGGFQEIHVPRGNGYNLGIPTDLIEVLNTNPSKSAFLINKNPVVEADVAGETFIYVLDGITYQVLFTANAGKISVINPIPTNGGKNYVVGDILTVTGGGEDGRVRVLNVGTDDAVTEIELVSGGRGYSVGTNVTTTGGSGDGNCTIEIVTVVSEPLTLSEIVSQINTESKSVPGNNPLPSGVVPASITPTNFLRLDSFEVGSVSEVRIENGTANAALYFDFGTFSTGSNGLIGATADINDYGQIRITSNSTGSTAKLEIGSLADEGSTINTTVGYPEAGAVAEGSNAEPAILLGDPTDSTVNLIAYEWGTLDTRTKLDNLNADIDGEVVYFKFDGELPAKTVTIESNKSAAEVVGDKSINPGATIFKGVNDTLIIEARTYPDTAYTAASMTFPVSGSLPNDAQDYGKFSIKSFINSQLVIAGLDVAVDYVGDNLKMYHTVEGLGNDFRILNFDDGTAVTTLVDQATAPTDIGNFIVPSAWSSVGLDKRFSIQLNDAPAGWTEPGLIYLKLDASAEFIRYNSIKDGVTYFEVTNVSSAAGFDIGEMVVDDTIPAANGYVANFIQNGTTDGLLVLYNVSGTPFTGGNSITGQTSGVSADVYTTNFGIKTGVDNVLNVLSTGRGSIIGYTSATHSTTSVTNDVYVKKGSTFNVVSGYGAAPYYTTDANSGATYTGTNISFTSPSTITRGSGSFLDDGFLDGQSLTINGSDDNDGYYTINTVAALTITVDETTITTDGSGPTISLGGFKQYSGAVAPPTKTQIIDQMNDAFGTAGLASSSGSFIKVVSNNDAGGSASTVEITGSTGNTEYLFYDTSLSNSVTNTPITNSESIPPAKTITVDDASMVSGNVSPGGPFYCSINGEVFTYYYNDDTHIDLQTRNEVHTEKATHNIGSYVYYLDKNSDVGVDGTNRIFIANKTDILASQWQQIDLPAGSNDMGVITNAITSLGIGFSAYAIDDGGLTRLQIFSTSNGRETSWLALSKDSTCLDQLGFDGGAYLTSSIDLSGGYIFGTADNTLMIKIGSDDYWDESDISNPWIPVDFHRTAGVVSPYGDFNDNSGSIDFNYTDSNGNPQNVTTSWSNADVASVVGTINGAASEIVAEEYTWPSGGKKYVRVFSPYTSGTANVTIISSSSLGFTNTSDTIYYTGTGLTNFADLNKMESHIQVEMDNHLAMVNGVFDADITITGTFAPPFGTLVYGFNSTGTTATGAVGTIIRVTGSTVSIKVTSGTFELANRISTSSTPPISTNYALVTDVTISPPSDTMIVSVDQESEGLLQITNETVAFKGVGSRIALDEKNHSTAAIIFGFNVQGEYMRVGGGNLRPGEGIVGGPPGGYQFPNTFDAGEDAQPAILNASGITYPVDITDTINNSLKFNINFGSSYSTIKFPNQYMTLQEIIDFLNGQGILYGVDKVWDGESFTFTDEVNDLVVLEIRNTLRVADLVTSGTSASLMLADIKTIINDAITTYGAATEWNSRLKISDAFTGAISSARLYGAADGIVIEGFDIIELVVDDSGVTGDVNTVKINTGGSNYVVGDILTINDGNTDAIIEVISESGGVVDGIKINAVGSGYSPAVGVDVTPDPYPVTLGTGLTVNVNNGSFTAGEVLTGINSSATGEVISWDATNSKLYVKVTAGSFVSGESVVGNTSGVVSYVNNIVDHSTSDFTFGETITSDVNTYTGRVCYWNDGNLKLGNLLSDTEDDWTTEKLIIGSLSGKAMGITTPISDFDSLPVANVPLGFPNQGVISSPTGSSQLTTAAGTGWAYRTSYDEYGQIAIEATNLRTNSEDSSVQIGGEIDSSNSNSVLGFDINGVGPVNGSLGTTYTLEQIITIINGAFGTSDGSGRAVASDAGNFLRFTSITEGDGAYISILPQTSDSIFLAFGLAAQVVYGTEAHNLAQLILSPWLNFNVV